MSNNKPKISEFSKRILEGVRLASKKMLESKSKNNGEIVVYQDGKVVIIPVSQLDETK